ncbi:hypothetical protein FB451DRAFT_1398809 [Mycena latifolia]|nr:hypothetical protein FB451DRAFT_1398809 [Mycena latifolia]
MLALPITRRSLFPGFYKAVVSLEVTGRLHKALLRTYEQLKSAETVLGMEADGKDHLLEKFRERAAAPHKPDPMRKSFDEELSKLVGLVQGKRRVQLPRVSYAGIPWGQHSPLNFSIACVQTVIDVDPYGLNDATDRILEFFVVGTL